MAWNIILEALNLAVSALTGGVQTAVDISEWRTSREVEKLDDKAASRALVGAFFQFVLIRHTFEAMSKLLKDNRVSVIVPLDLERIESRLYPQTTSTASRTTTKT
jgi:hypothetical protein